MSKYGDEFVEAFKDLLATFGCAVTYTVAGAEEGTAIVGILQDRDEQDDMTELGRSRVCRAQVTISTDASNGIASPATADQVTTGGETWDIVGLLNVNPDAKTVDLSLEREEPVEVSAEDFRR